LRREAGTINPQIEETRNDLERKEDELKALEEQIKVCERQISIDKVGIRECEGKLRGVPDVEALDEERIRLKTSKKHKQELRNQKIKEKQDLLFEYGKIIMLWPAINTSLQQIEEKRRNKELPPTIDRSLLESILKNKICSICDRPLDSDSEKRVSNLLSEIKLTSVIAQKLSNMENPLNVFVEKVKQFGNRIKTLTYEINNYGKDLEDIERRLNRIEKSLIGYEPKKVKEWYTQLKKYEEDLEKNQQRLGQLRAKRDSLKENIATLQRKLDEELKKEEKSKKITKQLDFCKKSLDIVRKTKGVIIKEMRERIEAETNKLFFQLLWKKETFKVINIHEDYDITLIHSMGYDCLGSVSSAERELLALSFTLALHTISGFESPILIDTPVARVSDEHRENFGKIFSQVSSNKQVILLFTPAEYSTDISKILDIRSSNKFIFKLSSNEKEVTLEVI
jgi:DNA sulfur modification protein DndD